MDNEIWRDVKDYEGYYQVSNIGRVRSVDRSIKTKFDTSFNLKGKVLLQSIDNKGYSYIILCKNKIKDIKRVHRLVADAFIENTDKLPIINHKNGNRTDNEVSNLEWCTHSHNYHHGNARKTIIKNRGIKCKSVNIRTDEVIPFDCAVDAAKHFNINETTVRKYINSGNIFNKSIIFKRRYV